MNLSEGMRKTPQGEAGTISICDFRFSITSHFEESAQGFDILGREVATLLVEMQQPGAYTVRWDASALPSGVYFYRLEARQRDGGRAGDASTGSARSFVETRRMVRLK